MTWILVAIAVVFVVRHLWKSYCHPTNVLTRQAANMNWVHAGRVKSPTGGHDTLLSRSRYTVQMRWRDGVPVMVTPPVSQPFKDFIEIERWIADVERHAEPSQQPETDPLSLYRSKALEVILAQNDVSKDVGTTILTMGSTDNTYLAASSALMETGFELGTDPYIIGMIHLTALAQACTQRGDLAASSAAFLLDARKDLLNGDPVAIPPWGKRPLYSNP